MIEHCAQEIDEAIRLIKILASWELFRNKSVQTTAHYIAGRVELLVGLLIAHRERGKL